MFSFFNNYRKDKVMEEIEKDTKNIIYASNKLKNDKDIAIKVIDKDPICFKYLGEKIKDNLDLCIYAIDKSNLVCPFVSKRIQNIPFVKEIIDTGKSLRLVIKEKIVLDASITKYFPTFLLKDTEFIKELLSYNGEVLKYTLPSTRDDEKMVLIAIKDSPLALRHGSKKIQNNLFLLFESLKKDVGILDFIKIDNPICNLIRDEHISLCDAILKLKDMDDLDLYLPREFVREIKKDAKFKDIKICKKIVLDDEKIAYKLDCIKKDAKYYLEVEEELKNSTYFAIKALEKNLEVLNLIPHNIRSSEKFLVEASKITSKVLLFSNNNDKKIFI